jgi:hypothetical protein
MNRMRRIPLRFLAAIVLFCVALSGQGQGARLQLSNLEKLGEKASHSTEVTLDGPLLEMVGKFMAMDEDQEDAEMVAIIKNLKGIYVKSFEFDEPNQYSQADVEAIRKQLVGPGWVRIVTDINKRTGEKNEIYLLKEGEKVSGVTILVAEARELTVVNIVGAIPMDKIAKFEDHFVVHSGGHSHKMKKESSNEKK